jgi:type 1 glutamine amidotransferase
MRWAWTAWVLCWVGFGCGASSNSCDCTLPQDAATPISMPMREPPRISVFSRTAGYRHESIEPARKVLAAIAERHAATFHATEDPAELTALLNDSDVVVFLMTTGEVLDDAQQSAFEDFIRRGGGFLGIHSAADTEYDWPFYETLNGAWFADHPVIQAAKLHVERADHPAVAFLPQVWERTDEWYNFRTNPRAQVDVLLTLDEASYQGGKMGDDHPIAWCHEAGPLGKGRAFYTALGHTVESWDEPLFLRHIEAALLWAAHIDDATARGVR